MNSEAADAPEPGPLLPDPGAYVEMGRLGRPYGVQGWSHVESWTDPPEALVGYRHWVLKSPDGSRRPARRQGRAGRFRTPMTRRPDQKRRLP